jgi:hypothetical protein
MMEQKKTREPAATEKAKIAHIKKVMEARLSQLRDRLLEAKKKLQSQPSDEATATGIEVLENRIALNEVIETELILHVLEGGSPWAKKSPKEEPARKEVALPDSQGAAMPSASNAQAFNNCRAELDKSSSEARCRCPALQCGVRRTL